MKKIAYLILSIFFLTACGKNTSTSKSTTETDIKEEALNYYNRAMDLHAEFVTERDTVIKAIALLDSAIIYQPDYISAYFSKQFYLIRLGKYEEALKTVESLETLTPDNTDIKLTTGLLYLLCQEKDAAEAKFQQANSLLAIRLDTISTTNKLDYLNILMNKALVLKFLQKEEEADKLFYKILNDSTFNTEPYNDVRHFIESNYLHKSKEEVYSFFVEKLKENEL